MTGISEWLQRIESEGIQKLVISKPASKQNAYKKIVVEWKAGYYQFSRYTEKQVFHENIQPEDLIKACILDMEGHYRQINIWTKIGEHSILISKKGECHHTVSGQGRALQADEQISAERTPSHNRKKQYLLQEGQVIPPLIDMGIFTKEGKVVHAMYDKYKQINRFLEIINDETAELPKDTLHIIDFGCGKSYLTFIVYYYLTEILGRDVEMIGLDLKEDVIAKCNASAKKYGYNRLRFEVGDIGEYQTPFDVDMVLTLHACDTATDYALYHAIQWKADMIFSVPCCQHELNQQIAADELSLFTRYGIVKERLSALMTDAVRANMLEYAGYKTQLLEFIDMEHTPKNILIRAVRRPLTPKGIKDRAISEVESVMKEFHVEPTLYKLLMDKPDTA
ncbi:MAG: SAM-dependent methyltransferase [Lachnospiraceae bacterium]|nr:SAM-dependent methyltransferase [Lachnospiraceae bacterium]